MDWQDIHKSRKVEGYWWSKDNPQYPMPEPNVLTPEEAREIYDLMVEKQKEAEIIHYFGMSTSRITDEMLGCEEYYTDDWVWTQDLGPHYVLKHLVRPSDEFLIYIGYL